MTRLMLFLITIGLALKAQSQNPVITHYLYENPGFTSNHVVTWVNNATLRKEPSKSSAAITTLPIGTVCNLIEQGKDTVEIAGIQSPWYFLEANGYTGWIWGGLMTKFCVGSNVDPEVKFLLGYQLYDDIKDDSVFLTFVQIRVVKNQQELANISFPLLEPMYEYQNVGSKGLEGVHDIISLYQTGESCGHFSGSSLVIWDGKKLLEPLVIGGVPDGDYGVWDSPIFPSDIEGQQGYLILDSEDYIDYSSLEDEQLGNVMERISKQTFLKWENGTWQEDKSRFKSKILYYTMNGSVGNEYYSEDYTMKPAELTPDLLDWINSHKKNPK